MIRPFTCLCLLFAAGSGLFLYNSKHSAHMLDKQTAHLIKSAQENRARAALLRAEYDRLGDPERLQALASQVLTLHPTDPKQFTSLADLEKRLPGVAAPPILAEPLIATAAPEAAAIVATADKPMVERPAPQALAMMSRPVPPLQHVALTSAPLISQSQAATAPPVVAAPTLRPVPLHPVVSAKPVVKRVPAIASPPAPSATMMAASRPRVSPPRPPQASDMVARLIQGAPSPNAPHPMVASALGMARAMLSQPLPPRP